MGLVFRWEGKPPVPPLMVFWESYSWTWFFSLKLSPKPEGATKTRAEHHAGSTLSLPLFISAVPARVLLPSCASPPIRVAQLSLCHPPRFPRACFWQNLTEMPRNSTGATSSPWHLTASSSSSSFLFSAVAYYKKRVTQRNKGRTRFQTRTHHLWWLHTMKYKTTNYIAMSCFLSLFT